MMMKSTILLAAAAASTLASIAYGQDRTFPATTYDCQVVTTSGARALVSIQADSLAEAAAHAVGQTAHTMVGTQERAVEVTECIVEGQDFSDGSFNWWKNSEPR